jgi:hypothetical protein
MEVRKASYPDKYLGSLVKPGSLGRFPSTKRGHIEDFTRITSQQLWKDASRYTTVIEHVRLFHDTHRAIFIGAPEFVTPDGRKVTAGREQPIFHVEHSAVGPEERPLNVWRIVHLTDGKDDALDLVFDDMAKDPYLRYFNEVYIREDLGLRLDRKEEPTPRQRGTDGGAQSS